MPIGNITWYDTVLQYKDVWIRDVLSKDHLTQFVNSVYGLSDAGIQHVSYTEDILYYQPAASGEYATVNLFLKVYYRDQDEQRTYYEILPAPKANILEDSPREGKRMTQEWGEAYVSYLSQATGKTLTFRHAHLIGTKNP